mmetsp:Transcript_6343/g.18132  ORF Transcript_6343/g.18132 Transcript_6343/m.18132 type:complete len:419 (-) Transcript_6343:19-1275(-)
MSGDVACYWEKQGADKLCAVHCINALLQGPHVSEVDLARHAHDLDAQERMLLAGAHAAESANVDATGNFSIGVLEAALKAHGYRCLNAQHPDIADSIRRNPSSEAGYICNSHAREHWFTIRKVKGRWWDLDSLKHAPQSIGDISLADFLETTRSQGFSIFVVRKSRSEGEDPGGGQVAELPEPLPGAYGARCHSNQHYLTLAKIDALTRAGEEKEQREADEARRIAGGDVGDGDDGGPSGPAFTVVAPADKRKQDTDWKSLGEGRSLGGGGGGAAADGADDPELQAVLRASALEAAQSSGAAATAVPEEPAAGTPGTTTIQVRLPNAKRLQRRFLLEEHTLDQLLAWVERTSVEDASLGMPILTACEAYALMKRVIPGGQLKIERSGGLVRIAGEDAGGRTLKDAGFQTGGEALTLQT